MTEVFPVHGNMTDEKFVMNGLLFFIPKVEKRVVVGDCVMRGPAATVAFGRSAFTVRPGRRAVGVSSRSTPLHGCWRLRRGGSSANGIAVRREGKTGWYSAAEWKGRVWVSNGRWNTQYCMAALQSARVRARGSSISNGSNMDFCFLSAQPRPMRCAFYSLI